MELCVILFLCPDLHREEASGLPFAPTFGPGSEGVNGVFFVSSTSVRFEPHPEHSTPPPHPPPHPGFPCLPSRPSALHKVEGFSTVVDAVGMEPVVLREGLGDSTLITG